MDRSNLPDPLPSEYPSAHDQADGARTLTLTGQDLGTAAWQAYVEAETGQVYLAGLLGLAAIAFLLPQDSVIPVLFVVAVTAAVQFFRRRAAYRCVGSPTPASHQRAELWSIAAGSTFLVCAPLLIVFVLVPVLTQRA